ncbi:MAG: recombinase family protein [Janthinobacterium lividum]
MADGKFVSYLRVSTAKQGASGLGLNAQRAAVAGFLNGGRWSVIREVVEVESGKRADRPKLAEALALCRLHGAVLLVAKLDRLSRNAAFLFNLRDAGVRFIAADMPEANEMTVGIMAVVAEGERKAISKRTTEALAVAKVRLANLTEEERADRIAQGKAVKLGAVRWDHLQAGGADRGRVVSIASRRARASSRAADLAPIIAELRAEGSTTLAAVAEGLNVRGIPAARGGVWTPMQVSRVLKQALA